jgi:ribonuclease D
LQEECAAMTEPARYLPDVASAWSKVKGANGLSAAAFGRLRALASWREETALRVDRPRRWILADDILVRLANSTPQTAAELAAIPDMPPAVARKYTDALLACLTAPPDAGERPDNSGRLDARQRELVKRLLEVHARALRAVAVGTTRIEFAQPLAQTPNGGRCRCYGFGSPETDGRSPFG